MSTPERTVLRHVVRHLREHAPHLEQDPEYRAAVEQLEEEPEHRERREEPQESKKGR